MIPIFDQIHKSIEDILAHKDRIIIAIDGSCAAGKSTLAAALAEVYDCNLFHMDDFFLQPHQRTPERYAEAGGNVDYERFYEEVLLPLKSGLPFSYRPFRCSTMTLSQPVAVQPKRLTIVEGTYSHHPYFGDPYDLKIFMTVSPELRERRILERPSLLHQRFFDLWIPLEQRYFREFPIQEHADLTL